ncbi:MAG: SseB family protein [Actinobacteria bacterium]|nr:SseB family protein [Actinomycetota bacterium]
MSDFTNSEIPETDFAQDLGEPSLALRLAMTSFAGERTDETVKALVGNLAHQRLLIPVLAQVDSKLDGVEKDSSMQAVEFVAKDGRRALLAFTGVDSVALWDNSARPIPRAAHVIAQAVLEQELDALIIDIAGPTPTALDGALLVRVAMSEHQRQYLESALNSVCDAIEDLDGVEEALWEITEEEVELELFVSQVATDLGQQIAELLQDPTFTVVLDRPLSVQVTQTKAN